VLFVPQIQYASLCLLNNPGCLFIATNADARGHFTPNQEWAGAGATVGAIQGEALQQGYIVHWISESEQEEKNPTLFKLNFGLHEQAMVSVVCVSVWGGGLELQWGPLK
jgi:hypothetical protein